MEQDYVKELHKSRVAFMIINDEILYLYHNEISHLEWYKTLGLPLDNFNNIIRGYAKKDKIIYYKGDFIYDDEVIEMAIKTNELIKKETNYINAKIYCGVIRGNIGEEWEPVLALDTLFSKKEDV